MDGRLQTLGSLLPPALSLAGGIKPFLFGFAFLLLNAIQQCNVAQNRPLRASMVSLLLGVCVFAQTRYAATGAVFQYAAFQIGAAIGVSLGIRAGHAMKR